MHPLVAEIDGIGDLAQRPAVETERADHALELGSSAVEVALFAPRSDLQPAAPARR
jgi:hypothetical protein